MAPQAFEGIKVADFSWVVVGPWIGRYLGDHGATVVRIETSLRPDVLRVSGPYRDNIPGINRSGMYLNYNCNKYGVSLNLEHPRSPEIAKRLVAWADIVLESYTPGTMKKWGLDYEGIKKINPSVIMFSTCNQGQTGPHAQHPGFGHQLASLAGFTQLTGWPDRLPSAPYAAYTDNISPHMGAAAIAAALDYRRRTGKGQHLDLSQLESSIHFLSPLFLDFVVNKRETTRMGNRCPYAAPHGVYPCRGNERWCAIAVFTDAEWESFCQVLGNPTWTQDNKFRTVLGRKKNEDELDSLIAAWSLEQEAEEVMARMQKSGVAAGVVQNIPDLYKDPQLAYQKHFWIMEQREAGLYNYDSPPFTLSHTPATARMPALCVGQHNEYVFKELLGMSEEEYVNLLLDGVFE